MTRRLKLAGMGLGALLLPACSTFRESAEVPPSQRIPTGYVVLEQPGKVTPGSRYDKGGTGWVSPPAALDPTKGIKAAAPKSPVKTDVAKVSEPKLPDEPLDLPPMPPPVVAVKHEKSVIAVPPAPESENLKLPIPMDVPAVAEPKSPPVDAKPTAFPLPTVDTGSDPIRRPEWPNLGPKDQPKSDSPPRVDALPEANPSNSPPAMVLVPQPEPTQRPEPNVSMKIDAPANDTRPAAALVPSDTMLLQAVRAFQAKRPQEALECIKHLDPTNQELVMSLMPLMVRLCEGTNGTLPPEELAMVIDRLQSASVSVKPKAAMQLDRVCFCRGVRKFSDIDPYEPSYEFHPGEMVFLYAEIKNFTCEPAAVAAPQPGYNAPTRGCNIRLSSTLEMRDGKQNLVWRTDLHKNDYSLTPPQDYYHTYRFCIPEKLPAGNYTLWLNIIDKPTGRAVRKPVEMRVTQS